MDYEALAKQFGGTSAPPTTDYAALAKQFGGVSEAAAPAAKQYASAVPQPGVRNPTDQPLPETKSDPGLLDRVVGTLEAPYSVALNAVGGALAPYAGVAGELVGGVNTPEGRAKGKQWGAAVQKNMTYTPQTQTAQDVLGYVGEKMQGVDLNAIPFAQGMTAAAMAPAAAAQVARAVKNEAGLAANAAKAIPAVTKYAEDKAAANLKKTVDNVGRVESAQFAPKHDILLNPEHSNPSTGANVRAGLIGDSDVNAKMSAANEPKWTAATKKDLGLPAEKKLTAEVFDKAHTAPELTKPYETARALPVVSADETAAKKLNALRLPELTSDTAGVAAKANAVLDELILRLRRGTTGNDLVSSTQELRRDAQGIYRSEKAGQPISPLDRKLADMKMGVADTIEGIIADSLPIAERDKLNAARAGHARLFAAEEATNLATGQVDPNVLAKMIGEKRPLTGTLLELGQLAANHPEIAQMGAKAGWTMPRITRATAAGALGGTLGGLVLGPAGIVPGMAVGAGVGDIAKRVFTKRMLTPEYQAAHAIPTDYRSPPQVNNLRPVEPGASNIVPFNPANALLEPENRPNWTIPRQADPFADVRHTGTPQMNQPPQLTVEGTRGPPPGEWNAANAPRTEPRAPTRGGQVFELDPISGKLTPVDRGIRGATPDTFQDYTATLRSAVEKMSGQTSWSAEQKTNRINSGRVYTSAQNGHKVGEPIYRYVNKTGEPVATRGNQAFDLTAAEKVAWDKTRVDLAEVMPGFSALEPKVIAERMMDRAWVADAVKKANEKAAAFDAIAKRSQDAQAANAAKAARERMLDLAESLEEGLRAPRAGSGVPKEQGPRTKAAIRKNNLAPENKNNLTR